MGVLSSNSQNAMKIRPILGHGFPSAVLNSHGGKHNQCKSILVGLELLSTPSSSFQGDGPRWQDNLRGEHGVQGGRQVPPHTGGKRLRETIRPSLDWTLTLCFCSGRRTPG